MNFLHLSFIASQFTLIFKGNKSHTRLVLQNVHFVRCIWVREDPTMYLRLHNIKILILKI